MHLRLVNNGSLVSSLTGEQVLSPPRIPNLNFPLTPAEILGLRDAPGVLVDDPKTCRMYLDLECRGYLRRVRSFNREHYSRHDYAPKHCWTRTELGESILGRIIGQIGEG